MKKIFLVVFVCLGMQQIMAQSLAINTDGSAADPAALLDVKSTIKGVLIPRMIKSEKEAIVTPATGLLIFQSGPDSVGFYFYNGTQWSLLSAAGTDWSTTGNNGTNTSTNFIGTIDNVALSLRQNNAWLGRLDNSTQNYLIGDSAGVSLTGTGNIAIGRKALNKMTSFGGNVAIGDLSLANATTTVFANTAIGYNSATGNTSGAGNTAVGYTALAGNLTGNDNTMIGSEAGKITTSSQNTGVGTHALFSNTSGNQNTALGYNAAFSNTTGVWNIVIGNNANNLNQSGSRNVAIGVGAMFFNTASSSTAVGAEAAARNTRPNIVAVGDGAAFWNSAGGTSAQGLENTAVGFRALFGNSVGNKNTAVGFQAMLSAGISSTRNTAVGDSAMTFVFGESNAAVGVNALGIGAGSAYNVVMGDSAMGAALNSNNNVALGYKALKNLNASSNTAVGYLALENITTVDGNTALGAFAGNVNTGDHNTFIGFQADAATAGITNATAIGNGATVNASDKIRIGNSAVTVVELAVAATVSDGRFKENVKEDVKGLEFINRLRPVTYNFNYNKFENFLHPTAGNSNGAIAVSYQQPGYRQKLTNKSQQVETGFIAQEVERAAIQSGYRFNGVIKPQDQNDNYSLDYGKMVVPLVKAVQELSKENDSIKKQNELLQKKNKQLEEDILLIKTKLGIN